MNYNLAQGFYQSSLHFPENTALAVGSRELSYFELRQTVQPIGDWLLRNSHEVAPRVGLLASRSVMTFAGILGACWAGGTYVPISTKLPEDRLIQLLDLIQAHVLLVDSEDLPLLSERVLAHCPRLILAPDLDTSVELCARRGGNLVAAGRDQLRPFQIGDCPVEVKPDHTAYIIFTSGTTGIPKGVMIPASAVSHFVDTMRTRYPLQPSDRIAGMTEITFDISVFDMFVVWSAGSSLLVVPASQLMAPGGFVRKTACTVIFTVPSVISGMQRMKLLTPNSMPSLRYAFFAGEPLPVTSASNWIQAAPNSIVEDLFGPTEATVVCIGQRFLGPGSATPNRGVVAIGEPFPQMEAAIANSALEFLENGERGELLLAGPQLSSGYFRDQELTRKCFPIVAGRRWYRTGDLAYCDVSGTFHHLGRIDNQVKVRGLRVELEEVEWYLREIYRTDSVAAVGWPVEHGSANGIVAFVSGQYGEDNLERRGQIKDRLPSYMVPSAVHFVDSLPLNANGKVNRKQLLTLLGEGKL